MSHTDEYQALLELLATAEARARRNPSAENLTAVVHAAQAAKDYIHSIPPPKEVPSIGNRLKPLSRRPAHVVRASDKQRQAQALRGWTLGGSPFNRAEPPEDENKE
jgi:hypothetical protein